MVKYSATSIYKNKNLYNFQGWWSYTIQYSSYKVQTWKKKATTVTWNIIHKKITSNKEDGSNFHTKAFEQHQVFRFLFLSLFIWNGKVFDNFYTQEQKLITIFIFDDHTQSKTAVTYPKQQLRTNMKEKCNHGNLEHKWPKSFSIKPTYDAQIQKQILVYGDWDTTLHFLKYRTKIQIQLWTILSLT